MRDRSLEDVRVALAISAFRADREVIELLRSVLNEKSYRFDSIVVVDSLGSGQIQEAIKRNNWPVHYENSTSNLGSAGNLARRMDLTAQSGSDWCYCLNHDGQVNADNIRNMVAVGQLRCRVGAVYPLLHHGDRPKPWEDARRNYFPSASNRLDERPVGESPETLWGSSNGALYNLGAYREGLRVWKELWMGYEDLGYGMLLNANGWLQLICRDAALCDIFEYKRVRLMGKSFVIADKPVWYSYYNIRNLILIQKKFPTSVRMSFNITAKAVRDTFKILFLEDNKLGRLGSMWAGILHGLAGRDGKGAYP